VLANTSVDSLDHAVVRRLVLSQQEEQMDVKQSDSATTSASRNDQASQPGAAPQERREEKDAERQPLLQRLFTDDIAGHFR
jgi:hypothetical protein